MKKTVIIGVLAIYTSAFIGVVSCTDKKDDLQKTHDRTSEEMTIVVHVYPNEKEVTKSYWKNQEEIFNRNVTDEFTRLGWAGWDTKSNYCEIHTIDIKYKNDKNAIQTLGHEMTHCLYGSFHSEVDK